MLLSGGQVLLHCGCFLLPRQCQECALSTTQNACLRKGFYLHCRNSSVLLCHLQFWALVHRSISRSERTHQLRHCRWFVALVIHTQGYGFALGLLPSVVVQHLWVLYIQSEVGIRPFLVRTRRVRLAQWELLILSRLPPNT